MKIFVTPKKNILLLMALSMIFSDLRSTEKKPHTESFIGSTTSYIKNNSAMISIFAIIIGLGVAITKWQEQDFLTAQEELEALARTRARTLKEKIYKFINNKERYEKIKDKIETMIKAKGGKIDEKFSWVTITKSSADKLTTIISTLHDLFSPSFSTANIDDIAQKMTNLCINVERVDPVCILDKDNNCTWLFNNAIHTNEFAMVILIIIHEAIENETQKGFFHKLMFWKSDSYLV